MLCARIASAQLVNVVPIEDAEVSVTPGIAAVVVHNGYGMLTRYVEGVREGIDCTDQLPFGDFSTDGKQRYA